MKVKVSTVVLVTIFLLGVIAILTSHPASANVPIGFSLQSISTPSPLLPIADPVKPTDYYATHIPNNLGWVENSQVIPNDLVEKIGYLPVGRSDNWMYNVFMFPIPELSNPDDPKSVVRVHVYSNCPQLYPCDENGVPQNQPVPYFDCGTLGIAKCWDKLEKLLLARDYPGLSPEQIIFYPHCDPNLTNIGK